MHGLTLLHDAHLDLGERGIQPQKTQICPLSADTEEFARHAAQMHLNAGTEAALTMHRTMAVLMVTLAPYQKGRGVLPLEFSS